MIMVNIQQYVIAIMFSELLFWQRLIADAFCLRYTSNVTLSIYSLR